MSDERVRTIRERAYAIWEHEGRPDGKAVDHWLKAEAEIGDKKIIGFTNDGKILKSSRSSAIIRGQELPPIDLSFPQKCRQPS
jgi:hypothetical protein